MYHGWSPVQLLATRYHSYLLWSAEAETSPFPYALSLPFLFLLLRLHRLSPGAATVTILATRFHPAITRRAGNLYPLSFPWNSFQGVAKDTSRGFIPAVFTRRRRQIHYSSAHAIGAVRRSFRSLLSGRGKRFVDFLQAQSAQTSTFLKKRRKEELMSYGSTRPFSKPRKPRHFAGRYPTRWGGFTLVADIPRISEPEENLLHCGEDYRGQISGCGSSLSIPLFALIGAAARRAAWRAA